MPDAIDKVKVGDKLPAFEKTFSSVDLFAYGAATWDWSKAHYDSAFARSLNVEDVFVDGQQFGALCARQVVDAFGPRTFIAKLKVNYRAMVFVNETVTGAGEVVAIGTAPDGATVLQIAQRVLKGDVVACDCTIEAHLRG